MIRKFSIVTCCVLLLSMVSLQAQNGGSCLRNIRVSTWSGLSSIDICQGDGTNDIFRFRTSSQAMLFAYLITDENDVILGISTSQYINLEGYPQGALRVYAFSYMGGITAQIGQHAFSGNLASICSALTINFVSVNSVNPDGGNVSFSDGAISAFRCVNNTDPSILTLQTTSPASTYAYVITNDAELIIDYSLTPSFDASMLQGGIYRIYGLAYAGNLSIIPGNTLEQAPLASLCYSLSDNYLSLEIGLANAGTIISSGGAIVSACQNDLNAPISFSSLGASSADFVFVLTDTTNRVISFLNGNTLLPANLSLGHFRVWGVSYSGILTLDVNDVITSTILSDECADLSDNFITVLLSVVDGGSIAATLNNNSIVCVGDNSADEVTVQAQGQNAPLYTFALIDSANELIIEVSSSGVFNLNQRPAGLVRIVGVAHALPVNFQPGLPLSAFAGSCVDVSDNALALELINTDGGTIALTDTTQSLTLCTGDNMPDILTFSNTSIAAGQYAYLAVNAANTIVAISQSGTFDFEGAGNGNLRVWGVAFHGSLLVQQGSSIDSGPLASSCYQLSENVITIQLKKTKGGEIALMDGSTATSRCTADGNADVLNFIHNSGFAPNYAFILIDDNNTILNVSTSGSFDVEGSGQGLVFVRGLAYTGSLIAFPGMNILTDALSDECFNLSSNVVTIEKIVIDGGSLYNAVNTTDYVFCGNDGFPDIAVFNSTTQDQQPNYAYLITDVLNTVILLGDFNDFDFEFFGAGTFRIWGMAYTGSILIQPGDNAANTPLADACYDLSDNFITITINSADAGSITHQQSVDIIRACAGDDIPDLAVLSTTANVSSGNYRWLVTNSIGDIVDWSITGDFDFDTFPADIYQIWGLAFSGNFIAQPGMNIYNDVLATDCYGRSQNFIQVRVDEIAGGQVTANNGLTSFAICFGDNLRSGIYTFNTSGNSTDNYTYFITNEDDIIVGFINTTETQFDDTYRTGTYRIRGVAFVGSLTAAVGDNLFNVPLASLCYDISENYITMLSGTPVGGNVKFSNGAASLVFCPSGNVPQVYNLTTDADLTLPYAFVVTDTHDVIIAVFPTGEIQAQAHFPDQIRIWGLSYTGSLVAQPGMSVQDNELSTECYSLSNNYRSVYLQSPAGGNVSLIDGSTTVSTCISDFAEVLDLFNDAGFPGSYVYLITNDNGVVLEVIPTSVHDFSTLTENSARVYGLAFTGNLSVQSGDNINQTLSDDCFSLSSNFIQVNASIANGGGLTTLQGDTILQLCAGDGISDTVSFSVLGASNATYLFLITDQQDFLIGTTTQPFFDFENAIDGVFRIHGLSYTGIFQLFPGDNIFDPIPAASGCYDFSSSFIEITNSRIDGGHLQAQGYNTDIIYVCPSDGVPDIVQFINNADAPSATYGYLFTNELNRVTGFTFQNSFDFNISGIGTTRIWGISFTGNLLANFGDDVLNTTLSDACFSLSDNYLTVIRDIPFGGYLTTADFETAVVYCKNVGDPILEALTSSNSNAAYVFVLTDIFNDILEFSYDGVFDLADRPEGRYRIWGLSYTGIINDDVVNLFDSDLGNSCIEISGNFIIVHITEPIVGGQVSANNGMTTAYFCPGDGLPDIFTFSTTSPTSAARYRFVVTNQNGLVFIPDVLGNTIDFEGAGVGEYRIYGIAFTGDYQVNIGTNINTAVLADSCFQRSSNFIRILPAIPSAGAVFAFEGVTQLNIDAQDGNPDIFPFANTGANTLPYLYIITDVNNNIIQYMDSNVFDFEGIALPALRVWGFSYFGQRPNTTGINISSLVSANNCNELSTNFVSVINTPTLVGNPSSFVQLSASPNPAFDKVNVQVSTPDNQALNAMLRIMDAQGKVRQQFSLDKFTGTHWLELDFSNFEPGVYSLQVSTGTTMAVSRIIKHSH
jgi:uncharacterized protein